MLMRVSHRPSIQLRRTFGAAAASASIASASIAAIASNPPAPTLGRFPP